MLRGWRCILFLTGFLLVTSPALLAQTPCGSVPCDVTCRRPTSIMICGGVNQLLDAESFCGLEAEVVR